VPVVVASGFITYSSYGLAGQEVGGATPRSVEAEADKTLGPLQQTDNSAEQRSALVPYLELSEKEWAIFLQSFVSSPERSELLSELGERLRQGDLTGAQQLLSATIDASTLALAIFDSIQNPALQAALQTIARERQGAAASKDASDGHQKVNEANASEHSSVAEGKSVHGDAALQELHTLREQLAASREKEARVAELEHAVEQEKERAASVARELNLVQGQLASITRDALKAADTQGEHARERDQANAARLELTMRLTAAREQIGALQKSAAEAAQLKTTLERERELSRLSAQEMDALKTQLATLQRGRPSAADVENSATREKRQADAALQQLNALQDKLAAFRASEAKMQDELQQERERNAATARQMEATQKESATLAAQVRNTAELRATLQQEKEKVAAMSRDLASLRREVIVLEKGTEFVPATVIFQFYRSFSEPLVNKLKASAAPSNEALKQTDAVKPEAQQASLPLRPGAPNKSSDEPVRAQIPSRKPSLQSVEARVGKAPSGVREPSPTLNKASIRPSRSHRMPAQEHNAASGTFSPDLPAILRPDDGLWQVY
jgi:myosin heavy subunit